MLLKIFAVFNLFDHIYGVIKKNNAKWNIWCPTPLRVGVPLLVQIITGSHTFLFNNFYRILLTNHTITPLVVLGTIGAK